MAQSSAMHCEDVALLPREVTYTAAHDTTEKYLAIHTHQRFFTYQIPTPEDKRLNVVTYKFAAQNASEALGLGLKSGQQSDDLVFRLRATLRSANMDTSDQGMRVKLVEEGSGRVVVDGSTEDYDERSVHLDTIEVSSQKSYVVTYEFFEKNVGVRSFEEKTISGGHMGATACSKPFVIQELSIMSKDLIIQRTRRYKDMKTSSKKGEKGQVEEREIGHIGEYCEFQTLDNTVTTLERGESGLYCDRRAFSYKPHDGNADELLVVYQKSFSVVGAEKEAVTYLFDLTLGFEFPAAAQLKAVLRRADAKSDGEFRHEPLKCLYDHHCIESEMLGKNEISLAAILTAGDYELVIFDQEENSVRKWLHEEAGLVDVPFSFELQASPVVQNEERVMCGDKLYLSEQFIQNRFIDHRGGQKFIFDDDIILNLINSSQSVSIVPEADMLLKVSAKEAYGVNLGMSLCQGSDCSVKSSQSGNIEMLFATVKKGREYKLTLDYSHSIVELHSFYDCPHVRVSIAMSSIEDARGKMKVQNGRGEAWIRQEEEAANRGMAGAFGLLATSAQLGDQAAFMLSGAEALYRWPAKRSNSKAVEGGVLTVGTFAIPAGASRQVMVEVYFDPQFYDMEILIESKESSDVRAHLYSGAANADITQFKGAKRVFIEAEPGEYKLKLLAKYPAISSETQEFTVKYVECQLYAIAASTIPSPALRPSSLNYYGLLGPEGKDFGQVTYHLSEVLLAPREFIDLMFNISSPSLNSEGAPAVDVQAIESDGLGDQLDISLREIDEGHRDPPKKNADGTVNIEDLFPINIVEKHPTQARFKDDWEDGIAFESLASSDIKTNSLHRIRLANRDPSQVARCQFKVIITEHAQSDKRRSDGKVLPANFKEIARTKPKVQGIKEGSFIQGSRKVMETFKVTALTPFLPASSKVYQAEFKTGKNTDDSFAPSMPFEVSEQSNTIYAQVAEYSGREDLFLSIYNADGADAGAGQRQVARSHLGKYSNALGPVTLPKGKYRLVVHPDQDSSSLAEASELIRFGLDVLVEKPGGLDFAGFESVVEEVELCSFGTLPGDFNGPGFLHPLSGQSLELVGKYRLQQALTGAAARLDLFEPSLVTFYATLPEGLKAEAGIYKNSGTRASAVTSADLNKDDESFLRQEGGYQHRAVVQVREFLSSGSYTLRLSASEATAAGPGAGAGLQARCEAYTLGLTVMPLRNSAKVPIHAECKSSEFIPEHMRFDEVVGGQLWYPVSESTVDVAYLDLKTDGEGPFIFHFSIQYDPRVLGVLGVSLSQYDQESTSFKQATLWRAPQDGLVQILTVVESGVYAVGIQTLTSTEPMFLDGGLGARAGEELGARRLPEACQGVSYSYMVASTILHDSRTLETGGLGLLALLAGDGLRKIAEKAQLNSKMMMEVGDATALSDCRHDDLPASLPAIAAGFDRSFSLLTQTKPNDFVDIIVEVESVLRVSIHSQSERNQVSVFLLEHPGSKEAVAWTKGSGNSWSFVHLTKPQKRAYTLKIVYDSLDQDDACPLFDLRIILKPVEAALGTNLACGKDDIPPLSVDVQGPNFELSGTYAFGRDFIHKVTDKGGDLQFDVDLRWPGADPDANYLIDIESNSDVLTGQMTFTLMYTKPDKSLAMLGRSHPVGSTAHAGRFTQRLKLLDQEGQLAEDVDLAGAILRLRYPPSSIHLVDELIDSGHIGDKPLCLTFQLSIRAELRGGANEGGEDAFGPSRLLRVRWEGTEAAGGLFDYSKRVTAVLEFDRSMTQAYKLLKTAPFATLEPSKPNGEQTAKSKKKSAPASASPTGVRLSQSDPSNLLLDFPAGSIGRGWCHALRFQEHLQTGTDFDTEHLGAGAEVCASTCLCHWPGTASCNEKKQVCHCRFPYTGTDCSQCQEGYTLDPATGECSVVSRCAENGGSETCNGHGECEQSGAHAVCRCEPGFGDDGLERCAKCTDPLFTYPDCQTRSLVIEEPDINCKALPHVMPVALWREGPTRASSEEPLQSEDGEINWGTRYRLNGGAGLRKTSTHSFVVPETLVFRLHVDTSKSGVLAKYRLLSDQGTVLLSSAAAGEGADVDGFLGQASEFVILHRPEGKDPMNAPFRLEVEYRHEAKGREHATEQESCPVIDIKIIAESLMTARDAIKCTDAETEAATVPRTSIWQFDHSTKYIQENITLNSADQKLYTHEGKVSNHFATLRYTLDVNEGGNALSILTSYPFSEVDLSLSLYDEKTGALAATERSSNLEGDDYSKDGAIKEADDMATYIEVGWLDAGRYRLEIQLRRSLFLPTKQFPTCLAFGLVVEYVARSQSSDKTQYEVLSVVPLRHGGIDPKSEYVIDVHFDRKIVMDDLVESKAQRLYICELVNTQEPSDKIHPRAVRVESKSVLRLDFNFASARIPDTHRCYKLQCSTKESKGEESIRAMQLDTNYCIATEHEKEETPLSRCNPHAKPKLDRNGRCICAAPYIGKDCEKCEEGFTPAPLPKSHKNEKTDKVHTVCVADLKHLSTKECNGNGRPKSSRASSAADVQCNCDSGYGGRYCDYCTNAELAYPDCSKDMGAAIYDSESANAFLARRRYDEHGYSTAVSQYFEAGSLEPTVFNEECAWVDFPDDLDRLEFSKSFEGGEFHISDVYVVNHRQDNVMKFVPSQTGIFKVLLQQPEVEEAAEGDVEAPFDIEIGVYDPKTQRFLASSMNRHLTLPNGNQVKLEHASLSFEVEHEHLQNPVYIFFRALNFTDDGSSHRQREGCLALYLEVEFRPSSPECGSNPKLEPSSQITTLKDQNQASILQDAAKGTGIGAVHSINDFDSTFFTYQDYYVPQSSEGGADWEVSISLQQKFIERNTLDLLIEILATDVSLSDIDSSSYPAQRPYSEPAKTGLNARHHDEQAEQSRGSIGPSCKTSCLVGAEKGHNEMLRRLELGAGSYVRVWLMQERPPSRAAEREWCANYQLLVSGRSLAPSAEAARFASLSQSCQAEELPATLNTHRYLIGLGGSQKDFHYRESFRVDHLWHNPSHSIGFKLTEPSVVRILAPVHRHLEFVLALNQDIGPYNHKTVLTARKEDYHSTIFAQLSPGEYHLKFNFISDAAILQLPCQTIDLEMAIMTLEHAKEKAEMIKAAAPASALDSFSLSELFLKSPEGPQTMYRHAALGWRHVVPGQFPPVDQAALYKEIMKEGFEISDDDEAGLDIELHSDFLLNGVNVAISNTATGSIIEDERIDSTGKLLVSRLEPGSYELILYTHECATNMDPDHGQAITSFDLLLSMSVNLVREASSGSGAAPIPVEIVDYASSSSDSKARVKTTDNTPPVQLTQAELWCRRHFSQIPKSLETLMQFGSLDISETYYVPISNFFSREISFTVRKGQDAIRVLVARSNAKIVLLRESDKKVILQSRPIEAGRAQLLASSELEVDHKYLLVIELSEMSAAQDGEASTFCEHFIMQIKTWDTKKVCTEGTNLPDISGLPSSVSIGSDSSPQTIVLSKRVGKPQVRIEGTGLTDLTITIDYSDSFYRTDFTLRASTGETVKSLVDNKDDDQQASLDVMKDLLPDEVDYSRKQVTIYRYRDMPAGWFEFKLHQRFKAKTCGSAFTIIIDAKKAASIGSETRLPSLTIYQSQGEENESPRDANRLPINLDTLKFMKDENNRRGRDVPMQFSGPVILDSLESQNVIYFNIKNNDTLFRMYAEHEGIIIKLTKDEKTVMRSTELSTLLEAGDYKLYLELASNEAKKRSAAIQPELQITILVGSQQAREYYSKFQGNDINKHCSKESNFPLALRQSKQTDVHQLLYMYPNIKVSKQNLDSRVILQTYHFRVNVTSRLYFEVGMHMINNHVALSMQTLGNTGELIKGKQRGNLNVLDIQVGPGDYSIAIAQIGNLGSMSTKCGIFSLQGLVEPIDLMSAEANSGEILQRGIMSCPEAADGDIIPAKIFGDKQQTRGGGELHVDATGHFMRRFRNVLFKLSREGMASRPEHDFVEITPVEDTVAHLAFLYDAAGREIKVLLTDSNMMGQEVRPMSLHKRSDIEGGHTELVTEYRMRKGGHYALQIIYLGNSKGDSQGQVQCSTYDLTLSITHVAAILDDAACKSESEGGPASLTAGLKHVITDRDLDRDGTYSFDKVMCVRYPQDFQKMTKVSEGGKLVDSMVEQVSIDLSSNYDLRASVDFEFDHALFTIGFTESAEDESGAWQAEASHEQSPLTFKRNNDHYKAVRRELVAEGVESHDRTRKHSLTLTSWQWLQSQDGTHLLGDAVENVCIKVGVKINIKSTTRSNLYDAGSEGSVRNPMVIGTRPEESPAFLHGRPSRVSFDTIFNTRPYLNHHQAYEKADEKRVAEAFRLKAVTVSLSDGKRSEILLEPESVVCSSKEYLKEYHVTVNFDLKQFENTATEKLIHAQLLILTTLLVDSDNKNFAQDPNLSKRGFPIYVFEATDQEEFLKEESNDVRSALEGSEAGREASKLDGDVAVEESDLDADISSLTKALKKLDKEVLCLCVHGTCRDNEEECSGGCDKGWTGKYCNTLSNKHEALQHVVQQGKKDFTKDGLYRPQVILDQTPISSTRRERSESSGSKALSQSSSTKPKKIDSDDSPRMSGHSTALQEQVGHFGELSATQVQIPPTIEEDSLKNQNTYKSIAMVVLVVFVLYILMNGFPSLSGWPGSGQPPRYKPVQRFDGEKDSDEEDEDPTERRNMLELHSLQEGRGVQLKEDEEEESYTDSRQPQNQKRNFPMTNFNRSSENQSMLNEP